MNSKRLSLKALCAGALLACAFVRPGMAAEVSGVRFPDSATVAGKELVLNGLGVRTKFIVKVYATGLYLPEKTSSVPDIMKNEGPRKVKIVMMRDLSSDDFGQAFMAGLNANLTAPERAKIIGQISKFGEMFALLDMLKKGDMMDLDYVPGSGTTCYLNGKRIGEVAPDVAFYNAILSIWIGAAPADTSLKPKLLGLK